MHDVINQLYADKEARNDFFNGYHHDIMTMLKQGFREMATDHMENLKRFREKFSLFD